MIRNITTGTPREMYQEPLCTHKRVGSEPCEQCGGDRFYRRHTGPVTWEVVDRYTGHVHWRVLYCTHPKSHWARGCCGLCGAEGTSSATTRETDWVKEVKHEAFQPLATPPLRTHRVVR